MEKGGEGAEPQGGGWSQDWPGAGRGGWLCALPLRELCGNVCVRAGSRRHGHCPLVPCVGPEHGNRRTMGRGWEREAASLVKGYGGLLSRIVKRFRKPLWN